MAASVQVLEVDRPDEIDIAVSSYVVQGYVLANKTAVSATMVKKKEFSALWAVIGLILCVIPLLIYLIVYAGETDKVVEIRLRATSTGTDSLAELERFAELHERGIITDAEYEEQKRRLL